ncbi:unnamed protein product [Strongylus vulgaris]|uniref:Uncharacterized protein n=1 Tax=Strongylus vulgaris TaxID=40348 RepID=A0A3P7J5T9_STRVU|nr:unnamed protein product [Strongylus vulgaris]
MNNVREQKETTEQLLSSPIHPRKISIGDQLFEERPPRPGEMIKEAVQMAVWPALPSYSWKRRDSAPSWFSQQNEVLEKCPCQSERLYPSFLLPGTNVLATSAEF